MAARNCLFAALLHSIAIGAVVAATLVVAVAGYFGMLAWAVFAGTPIGGILALPFMILLALGGGVAASILILCPVTIAASGLCDRLRWPRLAQVPVAAAFCVLEVMLLSVVGALWRRTEVAPALTVGLLVALVLLLPLGLYWWILQAGEGLRRLLLAIRERLRGGGNAEGAMGSTIEVTEAVRPSTAPAPPRGSPPR